MGGKEAFSLDVFRRSSNRILLLLRSGDEEVNFGLQSELGGRGESKYYGYSKNGCDSKTGPQNPHQF